LRLPLTRWTGMMPKAEFGAEVGDQEAKIENFPPLSCIYIYLYVYINN
jgi:hypothetical protein